VRDGKVEAGLLIHEGQLTYEQEGLRKIVDFGEWWAERTGGLPLPLGGNVIRRDLGPELISRLSRLLHDSIAFGLTIAATRSLTRCSTAAVSIARAPTLSSACT
jgi:1,4-dihydroxy-6-naphthoate synthase